MTKSQHFLAKYGAFGTFLSGRRASFRFRTIIIWLVKHAILWHFFFSLHPVRKPLRVSTVAIHLISIPDVV